MKKLVLQFLTIFSLFAVSVYANAHSNMQKINNELNENDVINSYVYLLSRYLVIRQEKMDIGEEGVDYNSIKYNETGKADFVNPNLDVAYMEAWFAVDKNSAIILEVPKITKRYYTVQLLDGWGEVITNINERTYADHPYGKFALCLEGSTAKIPDDAYKIYLPSNKVKMLARVELQDSWDDAIKLQNQFRASVIGNPVIKPALNIKPFTNKNLITTDVYQYLEEALLYPDSMNPTAKSLQKTARKVVNFMLHSEQNRQRVEEIIKQKAIPAFMKFATTKAGKYQNNWLGVISAGNYHGDYWVRSSANFVGIWANTSQEVVYYVGTLDSEAKPYVGGVNYKLHFSKEQLPMNNVNSFWSIILVDFPGYRVVPNPLNRFNFNNFSKFIYDKDGGLTLYIGPKYDKSWPKSNYLPSPKSQNERFSLTLRMYVPKKNVLDGTWFPPAVKKIER